MKTLRLIMGDQLSHDISSLDDINKKDDVVLMCEVMAEATHVKHHKKKIVFLFSAMRHFAEELRDKGITVAYTKLDDKLNAGSFGKEVSRAIDEHKPDKLVVTTPGEYRVLENIKAWRKTHSVPIEILDDSRFLCSPDEFADWAEGRKELRMEYFYREMRKRYGILMQGNKPEGGKWNYDASNRKPPERDMFIPKPYVQEPDKITKQVMKLVKKHFDGHFGDIEPFSLAVTRDSALQALDMFIEERLPQFGDHQDAMVEGEPWMYHAHIGFYLNCGLLKPYECLVAAERAYMNGSAPLNAVEGFIRQILGWREYVRGIYWHYMPDYAKKNHLNATRKLPNVYWGGDTKMNCMKQCVKETKENAYAHHIQRLMVLGNFALLTGLSVEEVNEWYLIVYADAFEWVEMPNVSGMVLYADGGVLASKPYAAGGGYINKMSDYCKGCEYDVNKKNGEGACPFNYLYWNFLIEHHDTLKGNHRMGMMYRTLGNMDAEKRGNIIADSRSFLNRMDKGEIV